MNPFTFMPPFGLGDAEQLRQAREHGAMLREEWRQANSGRVARPRGNGTLARTRRLLGLALIGPARLLVATARAGRPKAGLKVRHSEPGC
jgi:hypothetical protein